VKSHHLRKKRPRKEPEDGSKDELKLLPEVNQNSCLKITGDAQVFINPYEKASGDISHKIPLFPFFVLFDNLKTSKSLENQSIPSQQA
jgi:hypothetical protein